LIELLVVITSLAAMLLPTLAKSNDTRWWDFTATCRILGYGFFLKRTVTDNSTGINGCLFFDRTTATNRPTEAALVVDQVMSLRTNQPYSFVVPGGNVPPEFGGAFPSLHRDSGVASGGNDRLP
jgi:hypothetical protein